MKISLLIEGATERAFIPTLRGFLQARLSGDMPRLDPVPFHGRLPKDEKLRRVVSNLLGGRDAADAVIALTDVYTGTNDFLSANDAKTKMRQWVGPCAQFHPHVALHDFEAWLVPYWDTIIKLARSNRAALKNPENINHNNPPSRHLAEVFRTGQSGRKYVKPRDAARILLGKDLGIAAQSCAELKAFLNTILILCGSIPI